jgi:hypothetical protein
VLNPLSIDMFQSVKNDKLGQFILENPTVLAKEK